MARLEIKKIGNHWYPNVCHDLGADISFTKHVERIFNYLSRKYDLPELIFDICEVPWITNENSTIYINEEDLTRYYTTEDDFLMKFYIDNKEYKISAYLYDCITSEYQINLHKSLYELRFINLLP